MITLRNILRVTRIKTKFRYTVAMTRIIALSPKKNTKKRPYKSPKRLEAKKELLAKKQVRE